METKGFSFARQYCFDSFSTAKELVIREMGIAVLPIRLAAGDEKKKLIKRISLKGFAHEGFGRHVICATVSEEKRKDARIKKIVALLKAHFN